MSGQCGLDSDLRGLKVTNLPHQDDIRILADDSPKPVGKGEIDLGIDLDLADTPDLVFNRIFNSNYVDIRIVEDTERLIQGRCLSATGRTCNQNDSKRLTNHLIPRL